MTSLAPPLSLDPLIAEANERARRRRVAALAVISLACTGVGLTVAFRPSSSPGTRVINAHGISVRIPGGWFVSRRPFTGITWPVQRFVISSYRIPASGFGILYLPSSTGVLADVMEEFPALQGQSPPWQPLGHLHLGKLGGLETFNGQRCDEFTARIHGRHFYFFVWIGRHAPPSDTHRLLSILQRMKVK